MVLTLQSGRRGTAAVGLTPQSVGKIFAARTIILPKLPVYLYGEAGYQLSAVNIDTGSLSPHWKHDTSQPTGDSAHGWLNFYFARSKCTRCPPDRSRFRYSNRIWSAARQFSNSDENLFRENDSQLAELYAALCRRMRTTWPVQNLHHLTYDSYNWKPVCTVSRHEIGSPIQKS